MLRVTLLGLAALSLLALPTNSRAEIGICCFEDGSCVPLEKEDCWSAGGCDFIPGAD